VTGPPACADVQVELTPEHLDRRAANKEFVHI
jgi:hypothetical protein